MGVVKSITLQVRGAHLEIVISVTLRQKIPELFTENCNGHIVKVVSMSYIQFMH